MFAIPQGAALTRTAFGCLVCLWVPAAACLALEVEHSALFPVDEDMIRRWTPDEQSNRRLREKIANPSSKRMYALDMRALADACGIDLERSKTIDHYTWKLRGRRDKSAARGDLVCAVFRDNSMASGYALMQGGYTAFGCGLVSPSGAEYGDITLWARPTQSALVPRPGLVGQPSRPTYVRGNVVFKLLGHHSGTPMMEEQLIARLDAFVGRELSRQNARAQAILGKLGVTAQIALDNQGAVTVSGEVVCLSSDFPWCVASLHPMRGRERVVLTRGKTVAFEIEAPAHIERTQMYRHSFTAGPYAVPEGAEEGTLDLMFRDEGGVVFGNRWRLDFRGRGPADTPGPAKRDGLPTRLKDE